MRGPSASTASLHTFALHVKAVAFSPDEGKLIGANRTGTVKIWGSKTGAELMTLRGHTDAVNQRHADLQRFCAEFLPQDLVLFL